MSKTPECSSEIGYGAGIKKSEWKEIKDWWLNRVIPNHKSWDNRQTGEAARFLASNQVGISELVRSKLESDKRLLILGMTPQLKFNNLYLDVLKESPRPGFIAVEVRDPLDNTGGFLEDKTGMTTIELGGGMKMDLSHQEARRLYPDKYQDPDKRNTEYDELVAAARDEGLDVLYTVKGSSWREMNSSAAEEIATYMKKYPNARGVYFSSIYSALKWPGYKTPEEQADLGYGRPLALSHIFSTDPRTDTSVRMPAYALEQEFPGQIFSAAQFVMPKGYGIEWKNLNSAVEICGIRNRFAIDNIATSPFAVQRLIFRGATELSEIPDEELWKYYGTLAQGFFGPMTVRWDKVLDGVMVYPSEEQLQAVMRPGRMLDAAGSCIASLLENKLCLQAA